MNRDFVISQFKSYAANFDAADEGVSLKLAHSLRVSSWCDRLARALHLSPDDVDLAWLIGVLHDIGRFEQLREYHTFIDYQSMDHAKYGARYLFRKAISAIFCTMIERMSSLKRPLLSIMPIACRRIYRRGSAFFASSSAMPINSISLRSVPTACGKV